MSLRRLESKNSLNATNITDCAPHERKELNSLQFSDEIVQAIVKKS